MTLMVALRRLRLTFCIALKLHRITLAVYTVNPLPPNPSHVAELISSQKGRLSDYSALLLVDNMIGPGRRHLNSQRLVETGRKC